MKIEWSLAAVRDLDEIQEYIQQHSPKGAERVWVRVHQRIALQAEIPFAAPLYRGGPARMLVVTGTPYLVFYVVEGDVLRVEQIVHGAQNR
jgi:toxin ParE1/3/4